VSQQATPEAGNHFGQYSINGFVGVTDNDWFAFFSQQPGIDEVTFWQSRRIGWQVLNRDLHSRAC
jgi:hypothetical protein